jgi:hypothetical protein
MDSSYYVSILRHCLRLYYQRHPNGNFVFVQDNAPVHVSRVTTAWFNRNKSDLLGWPLLSRLKLIENFWRILVRRIDAENKRYNTVQELKDAIWQAWVDIDQETIDNLVHSMENRIFQVACLLSRLKLDRESLENPYKTNLCRKQTLQHCTKAGKLG